MWRQGLPIILDMYVEILINITNPLGIHLEKPCIIYWKTILHVLITISTSFLQFQKLLWQRNKHEHLVIHIIFE